MPNPGKEPLRNEIPDKSVGTMFVIRSSETIIWKELKEGDVNALGELYDLYVDTLFSFGMQQVQDRFHVMDSIHDLFLDLFKYRKNLAMTDNVKFYLFRSLKRKINKKYHSKIIPVSGDIESSANAHRNHTKSHEEDIILSEIISERSAKLYAALNALTKKQRRTLFYRFNQGLSYQEIADIMGVSIQTSRTTIYRAIKMLREQQSIIFQ